MNVIKKNQKLIIIIIFIIIILASIILGLIIFKKVNGPQKFENDYYKLEYEKKWNIIDLEENITISKNTATINIEKIDIPNNQRNMLQKDLFDEVLYYIEEKNEDYELLNYIYNSNTENNYDGIQVLYNYNDKEILITLIYYEGSIIKISYLESEEIFDYYLDDVLNIIWGIEIK